MSEPWTEDEIAWAKECFFAGDTLAEIAEAAGRDTEDVSQLLRRIGRLRLTPTEREILSLYSSGCSFREIDRERGFVGAQPGKAAAACITALRKKGVPIPHRLPAVAIANSRGASA